MEVCHFHVWDECFCSVYMHLFNSSCLFIKSYAYKRNVDNVNSQLSQPLKCLRICVTNALRWPLVNGHPTLLRYNYCILTSLLTWNSRAVIILITCDIIVLIKWGFIRSSIWLQHLNAMLLGTFSNDCLEILASPEDF